MPTLEEVEKFVAAFDRLALSVKSDRKILLVGDQWYEMPTTHFELKSIQDCKPVPPTARPWLRARKGRSGGRP